MTTRNLILTFNHILSILRCPPSGVMVRVLLLGDLEPSQDVRPHEADPGYLVTVIQRDQLIFNLQ